MISTLLRDLIIDLEEYVEEYPKAYDKFKEDIATFKNQAEVLAKKLDTVSPNEIIKECPLCGGMAKFIREDNTAFVKCQDCGCRGPKFESAEMITFGKDKIELDDGSSQAIDGWNARMY